MTSLKARLVLAFSLVTLIPLAIAVAILTTRIQAMVRGQAEERLTSALEGVGAQAAEDGTRIAARVEILARDAQLKRLYLVRPEGSRDLSDYLAERQVLLGLDLLAVRDSSGHAGQSFGTPSLEAVEKPGALAMIARSPILYQGTVEGVVEGGTRLDAAMLQRLGKASGVEWILRDASGRIAATTLPTLPSGAIPGGKSFLTRTVPLLVGAPPYATLTGLAPTDTADRAVRAVWLGSGLLALLGLLVAIPLATLWSAQISRPVERLAQFSEKVARGNWDEPLTMKSAREIETLVTALDRMRLDLKTYREKLVTSERQAAWSQMARKVAHEVKNPLTPIAISIEDLKRSYEQKRPDFPEILNQAVRTIGEEVETLRRLLQEFSDFARIPPPRLTPCRVSSLFLDLEALYGREIASGRLVVRAPGSDITFDADAGQMKQMLINLVKNGLEALNGAGTGSVTVSASEREQALELAIVDSGPGLTAEQRANLFVPGFTTKTHGSGLGLTIVERIVSDHEGAISVDPPGGRGTTFRVRLPLHRSAA